MRNFISTIFFYILFHFFGFNFSKLSAGHIAGGNLQYQYLGNNKYLITAKVYRDCRGVSLNSIIFGVYSGYNGDKSCGSTSLTPTLVSIKDISRKCSTATKPCNPTNTSYTGEGIEEHIYTYIANFSVNPFSGYISNSSCNSISFYFSATNARSASITTGLAGSNIAVTCTIYTQNLSRCLNKFNNSIRWNPIATVSCCNQPVYLNFNGNDSAENDETFYHLVPALTDFPNQASMYNSPFSYQYPLTPYCVPPTTIKCTPNIKNNPPRGFYFDTISGEIIYTPTKCDEVAVIAVKSREYRLDSNGIKVLIGEVMQDQMITVKDDCGYNYSPVITLSQSRYKVCAGDTARVLVHCTDEQFTPYQKKSDSISVYLENTYDKNLTLTMVKNSGINDKTYLLTFTPEKSSASISNFRVMVTCSDNNCPKPMQIGKTVIFEIVKQSDTIASFTVENGYCNNLILKPKTNASPNNFFYWHIIDSSLKNHYSYVSQKNKKDTTGIYVTPTLPKNKYAIFMHGENMSGCQSSNSKNAITKDPPEVIIWHNDSLCEGDTLRFKPFVQFATPPYTFLWSNKDSAPELKFVAKNSAWYNFNITVTDSNNCVFTGATKPFMTQVYALPPIRGKDTSICPNETVNLDAKPIHNETYKYSWNTGEKTNQITTNMPGLYSYTITDSLHSCTNRDTFYVIHKTIPRIELDTAAKYCLGVKDFNLNTAVLLDGKTADSGVLAFKIYAFNHNTDSAGFNTIKIKNHWFPNTAGIGIYTLKFENKNQECSISDTFHLLVAHSPVAKFSVLPSAIIFNDSSFNFLNQSTISDNSLLTYLWNFGRGPADTSGKVSPAVKYPFISKKYSVKLTATSNNGCVHSINKEIEVKLSNSTSNSTYTSIKITSDLIVKNQDFTRFQFILYDGIGRKVYTSFENTGISEFSKNLKSGIYYYSIYMVNSNRSTQQLKGKFIHP